MHEGSVAAAFAMLIPIVAIIMGIGIAMLAIYLDFRKKSETLKLYHAERMAAIEKGIELPPLPDKDKVLQPTRRRAPHAANRNGGLILLFLGIAVTLALYETAGDPAFWWGLVIVALGIALLVVAYFEAREHKGAFPGHSGGSESADRD
jgi:hypothetical protein